MLVLARGAMNTIPTIFNENIPSYTVVGGKERLASTGLSAVILNRSRRYSRRAYFQEMEKKGFDYVISVEPSPEQYDIEELSGIFPFVRFILPGRELSMGEQINIAVSELDSPLFFVLWNDLKIIAGGTALRMAERLRAAQEETEKNRIASGEGAPFKRLCTVPLIMNSRFETLPTLTAPLVRKKKVKPVAFTPFREGLPALYPFDGVGIYDRGRFIRLGGFDVTLKNSHWQLMDFGFRGHLWGEQILSTQIVKLSYDGPIPTGDNTPEESYLRFYLKNLAPVFRGDCAHLPLIRFPGYLLKSGEDILSAWENFSESRRWINTNRFRWKGDARMVTALWDTVLLEKAEQ
jgi:hypothetical protein